MVIPPRYELVQSGTAPVIRFTAHNFSSWPVIIFIILIISIVISYGSTHNFFSYWPVIIYIILIILIILNWTSTQSLSLSSWPYWQSSRSSSYSYTILFFAVIIIPLRMIITRRGNQMVVSVSWRGRAYDQRSDRVKLIFETGLLHLTKYVM